MKVAIIGTGRMGRGFATALAPKHQVTVGSRDPDRATAAQHTDPPPNLYRPLPHAAQLPWLIPAGTRWAPTLHSS